MEQTNGGREPVLVRAKFAFKGANNDELCFGKGDIITLTQQPDGGWWEGTFDDATGWFPANFVAPIAPGDLQLRSRSPGGALRNPALAGATGAGAAHRPTYRALVLKDLITAEQAHVKDLATLLAQILAPIREAKILPAAAYESLVGNLEAVCSAQQSLADALKTTAESPSLEQRVGGEMIRRAPALKRLLCSYCRNHPFAVQVLQEHALDLERLLSEMGMGKERLVTGLSFPFRHLAKYPTTLQELERNMEEGHADRGDALRAAAVFRSILESCEEVRKVAETELELLSGAGPKGWPSGRDGLARLGRVAAAAPAVEVDDEGLCTALLHTLPALLLLQRAPDSYVFKEALELSGWKLSRSGENPKELSLSGPSRTLRLLFMTLEETNRWVEAFGDLSDMEIDESCLTSPTSPSHASLNTTETRSRENIRPEPSKAATLPPQLTASAQGINHEIEMIDPAGFQSPDQSTASEPPQPPIRSKGRIKAPLFGHYTLLPHPAPRAHLPPDPSRPDIRLRKRDAMEDVEDMEVLRVVEAHCQPGLAAAGGAEHHPQLIVAEDEKIIIEEMIGDDVVFQEKSLVDTVYALAEKVGLQEKRLAQQQEELSELRKSVERERKARKRLESARATPVADPSI